MRKFIKRVLILLILSFIFFLGYAVFMNAGNIWKTFLSLPFAHKDNIISAVVGIVIYIIACKISSLIGHDYSNHSKNED